jgi:hypothetical protein
MRKTLMVSLYSACLSLAIAGGCLIAFPVTVRAASCSATCSNGSSITTPPGTTGCGCHDAGGGAGGYCIYNTSAGGSYGYTSTCR